MGLSGAAKKQRIQDDPRNLRWAQDTSAPGFRLLASMGWDPSSNPSLGNSDSQALILQNGGTSFSKKISSIPIAKEDNLGIGMKRGTSASVVGSLKALGVPPGSSSNLIGLGSGGVVKPQVTGFVTAGSGSNTPNGQSSSQGGEFGGLLARLNKLKEQGSLVATPIQSDTDTESKKRKRSSSTSSSSSSSSEVISSDSEISSSDEEEEISAFTPSQQVPPPVASTSAAASSSFAQAILKNPRMAARSKHLRAKRLASSSNALAMAEILGLAPTPTASSPSTSGTSTPTTQQQALNIAPPNSNDWPKVPEKGTSAIVQQTIITTVNNGGETEKEKKKRERLEKKARNAEKAIRREAKAAARKQKNNEGKEKKRERRSPSPVFKVHSAQHDPFHVTSQVPTEPVKASGIYSSMFVSSKQGGMGATWTPPTHDGQPGKLNQPETATTAVAGAEDEDKKEKKKKSKKDKKRKSSDREGEETKEEKRARKEAKRAKKEGGKDVGDKKKKEGETKEEKKARKEAKRVKKEGKK